MNRDANSGIARQMLEHCYQQSPRGFIGQDLLNTGRFPEGWVETYLDLVEKAQHRYAKQLEWPREIVAAAYVASVYCDKRYRDWLGMGGATNTETESALQRIRWAGDSLILGWFYREKDSQVERPDVTP